MDAANELEADDGAIHGFWAFVLAVRAGRIKPRDWNPDRVEQAREFFAAVIQFEEQAPQ